LGVLTAIAVMAALVPALATSVASAAPAAVAVSATDVTTLSACPASASTPAAGFTDTTSTDVDCIAYYGITTGVTSTTYEPSSNIPRWQMALYLTRFMDVTGTTLGSGADQGFTDISGYSAAIQTAINQIKQAGVTTGKTATTYDPDSNVTREEMTMFITRALATTAVGYNGSNDADALGLTLYINGSTATYNYDDIDSGVTWEGHNTIIEAYNLGLTGHLSTARTFSPAADITRADMATWLTNALGHTKARPTGLHMQSTDVADFGAMTAASDELVISNRDASFDAIANTSVDVMAFYDDPADSTDLATSAATGKCDDMVTAQSSTLCTMDVGDSVTNAAGNVVLEMASMAAGDATVGDGQSVQYWAWTAANGTVYDSTQTTSTVTIVSTTDSTQLKVSSSQPKATRSATPPNMADDVNLDGVSDDDAGEVNFNEAKYGSTITLTFQLYDSATVNAKVSKALTLVTVVDAYGASIGSQPTSVVTTKLYTGADGSVTHDVVCGADTSTSAGDSSYRRITWTSAETDIDLTTGGATAGSEEFFMCQDETAAASTSTVTIADKYKNVLGAAALTPVTSTVTGTVYDQYGNVVANQAVAFDSDMTNNDAANAVEGLLDGTVRTTNGSGQATASLSVTGTLTGMETVTFCVDDAADGCLSGSDTAEKTANIFWVLANDGTSDTGGAVFSSAGADLEFAIMVVDAPNDTMVVRGTSSTPTNTYSTVPYDANDQFTGGTDEPPISLSDFETAAVAATCTVLTGYECSTPWDWNGYNIDYNAVTVAGTGGVSIFNRPA
jgi:hypothetical protein